jgi:hypothetical protein
MEGHEAAKQTTTESASNDAIEEDADDSVGTKEIINSIRGYKTQHLLDQDLPIVGGDASICIADVNVANEIDEDSSKDVASRRSSPRSNKVIISASKKPAKKVGSAKKEPPPKKQPSNNAKYTMQEIMMLLEIVQKHVPMDGADWGTITDEFNISYPSLARQKRN